jgi:hypothetical protein
VRVKAHCLTYYVGGFCSRARQQPHFVHGVQEFAVRGFEAVDFGQGAGNDYAHGVGHIVFFEGFDYVFFVYFACAFDVGGDFGKFWFFCIFHGFSLIGNYRPIIMIGR